ncbi:caltractin-like [Ctenocephalides felis]|uniref:caltractin-like n=1 Tax=Ctenocephalides felis TaxID=7515 RepID=UPI000E6E45AF|nr:caltractin-like [Ctenocephalides felis]
MIKLLNEDDKLGKLVTKEDLKRKLLPGQRTTNAIPTFQLSEEQKNDLKQAFELFDKHGIGTIELRDLKVAIRALGYEPTNEEMMKMTAEVEKDGTGKLDFPEFQELLKRKIMEPDNREDILKSFRLFDDDETGRITLENMQRVAEELGVDATNDQLQEMLDDADTQGNGYITAEEFIAEIMKTSLCPEMKSEN